MAQIPNNSNVKKKIPTQMWHFCFITEAAIVHMWNQRQLILTCIFCKLPLSLQTMHEWQHISCHKHYFPYLSNSLPNIHYCIFYITNTSLNKPQQLNPHKWHSNLQQQHINSPSFQRRSSSVTISTLLNRLYWNWYTFSDSGKQPAIPVMTMSSPVRRRASVETGMSCSYGRFYCK